MAMEIGFPGTPLPQSNEVINLTLFEEIAASIEECGYFVRRNALPVDVINSLKGHANVHVHDYHLASVGRGKDNVHATEIRSDKVAWLVESNPQLTEWFTWTRELKQQLNRSLFLGLFSFECHLARYEYGDFYKKHVDAFRGEANRILTLVTYLNDHWTDEQGGQLVLYAEDGKTKLETINPEAGTVVIFLSEEFPHEVLPSFTIRHSVAGWFRLNSSVSHRVDPPR